MKTQRLLQIAAWVLLIVGIYQNGQAQIRENNSNNITFITAPGTYIDLGDWIQPDYSDDGLNFGFQYEHQWEWEGVGGPYVGGEIFFFPDLNDIDYTHIIGRFGYGIEIGNPVGVKWRGNVGFRGGRVFRKGYDGPHALLGLEVGSQVTLPCGLFGKLIYARDMKSDSAIWGEDNHKVNSVFFGAGVRF